MLLRAVLIVCLVAAALAAPIAKETPAPTTTTATTIHASLGHGADDEEVFFADEEANFEPYAETEAEAEEEEKEFDEEYQRYLDEMAQAMLEDKSLREEIIKELAFIASEQDLSNGDQELLNIAHRLQEEDLRTELDEQERQLVERQRRTARRENEHDLDVPERADEAEFNDKDEEMWDDPDAHKKEIRHIVEQRVKLMTNIDQAHHEAFIEKEMERELEFRERVAKEKDPKVIEELTKQHNDETEFLKHSQGHHPGSRQQLQEIWAEEDGLKDEKFNPVIFFSLHDLNGDGYLDIKELEALFYNEALKLHLMKGHEVDNLAVMEEMRRMREHVVAEMDTDQDGLISEDEFQAMTHKTDFNSDPAWTALVPEFTEEKLREFASRRRAARIRNRLWNETGEHVDEALIAATKRLELELWKQAQRTGVGAPGQVNPAGHHEQPKPAEHHDQPKPVEGHPAPVEHHEQPKPVEHHEQPKPVEHHEQPKPVEHHEQPKPVEHHEQPKPAEHHEQPKPAEAHPAPVEHHDQPKPAEGAHPAPVEHHEQPKPAEAKPAEAKPAEAHPAPVEHHDAKPAEAKPAEAHPAPVEHHDAKAAVVDPAKPVEAKPVEAKPAEAHPAPVEHHDAKAAVVEPPKPAEAKPAEAKPAESKPAEAKPAESKPAEAQPVPVEHHEAKPAAAAH